MDYKEFSNPLESDYDITSSKESEQVNTYALNPYEEYLHPNAKTILKVKDALGIKNKR